MGEFMPYPSTSYPMISLARSCFEYCKPVYLQEFPGITCLCEKQASEIRQAPGGSRLPA